MGDRGIVVLMAALAAASSTSAQEIVFMTGGDNGYFTPIGSDNAATVVYGDSGWLGGPGASPVRLGTITLNLATLGGSRAGSADLVLTINDGDPSGLVFGSGVELFGTVIKGVPLPASPFDVALFSIEVPIEGAITLGGFNNVGWSVRLENFDFDGQFGFQVGSCNSQFAGFYTNNASFFDGTQWSLFSFGANPCTQIAQFSVTITAAPPVEGDLTGDGLVNGSDIAIVLGSWGPCIDCAADFDFNGTVDGSDLAVVLGQWSS